MADQNIMETMGSTTPQPLHSQEDVIPESVKAELRDAIISTQGQMKNQQGGEEQGQYMYQLKKDLLLLATLAATVTYAAGLNLPGGSWLEDDAPEGHVAGDSILRETSYKRYIVFYYLNALSFATSLLVSLLVLLVQKQKAGSQDTILFVVRTLMVFDLFCLTGAYTVGGSHDRFTVVCASVVLVFIVLAYFVVLFLAFVVRRLSGGLRSSSSPQHQLEKHLEILMVLAIFVATITYVAGLNPPGGFWRSTQAPGQHTAGDPVLQAPHPHRYKAFFFFNTVSFSASLLAVTIIVDYERLSRMPRAAWFLLYALITTALLGLGGAYATGSCRDGKHTAYVLCLVIPVLVFIFGQTILTRLDQPIKWIKKCIKLCKCKPKFMETLCTLDIAHSGYKDLEKTREYIQLLATLVATIAYQAGVDPPGGVWSDSGEGHNVGDPILLTTHPGRYKFFFYSNSASFVASLVVMVMLQNEHLVRRHALEAALILDLFGLIGAYAAGSCRDASTSVYLVAIAGAVLIYVVIHIVFFTLDPSDDMIAGDEGKLESMREVLLLLAILAATLTYQAGLTPPGGFWEKDDTHAGHRAGFAVLHDKYPRRYQAFFYCNAVSFMASVALIVLLLNPNLYKPGIRCNALLVSMVLGMVGLMGAYAAGSSLHLRTSIIVLALVVMVFLILVYQALLLYRSRQKRQQSGTPSKYDMLLSRLAAAIIDRAGGDRGGGGRSRDDAYMATVTYLMLVGILAASVTYVTGLKPPGGLWRDDGDGHSAGNPVLYDIDKPRYNTFFYSNSTSLVASVTVMAFLLRRMVLSGYKTGVLWHMHITMLLNILALLIAYAAGSARDWVTSGTVIVMPLPILAVVFLLFALCRNKGDTQQDAAGSGTPVHHCRCCIP